MLLGVWNEFRFPVINFFVFFPKKLIIVSKIVLGSAASHPVHMRLHWAVSVQHWLWQVDGWMNGWTDTPHCWNYIGTQSVAWHCSYCILGGFGTGLAQVKIRGRGCGCNHSCRNFWWLVRGSMGGIENDVMPLTKPVVVHTLLALPCSEWCLVSSFQVSYYGNLINTMPVFGWFNCESDTICRTSWN